MKAQSHSRPVILCVDDHETGLQLRKRLLEKVGYMVLVARTAHKALDIFRARQVDLVLTERVAPALVDAPTIAAAMKMLKPDVPVAVLSADVQASPEDRRFAYAFITKLVSVDELLLMIRKLLMKRVRRPVQLARLTFSA
jgi:two-component system response regulator SaeR